MKKRTKERKEAIQDILHDMDLCIAGLFSDGASRLDGEDDLWMSMTNSEKAALRAAVRSLAVYTGVLEE